MVVMAEAVKETTQGVLEEVTLAAEVEPEVLSGLLVEVAAPTIMEAAK
jgi:hypothetical protein